MIRKSRPEESTDTKQPREMLPTFVMRVYHSPTHRDHLTHLLGCVENHPHLREIIGNVEGDERISRQKILLRAAIDNLVYSERERVSRALDEDENIGQLNPFIERELARMDTRQSRRLSLLSDPAAAQRFEGAFFSRNGWER